MPTSRPILAASVVALLLVACAGGPDNGTGASADSSGESCEQLIASAANEVQSSIDANAACSADADCVGVERVTNCFATCESPVSRSGLVAFNAARDRVNAAQCARFQAQGCTPPGSPPCYGLNPLACVQGHCSTKDLAGR